MPIQTPVTKELFASTLKKLFLGVLVGVLGIVLLTGVNPPKTAAATSDTLNFQAKLMTAAGGIAADGNYNVEFNLYNASTGGTALWTEDYLNSATQGVRVANGYLTVNLGSITPFPGTINWDQNLYIGMTVRGTGSCSFAACTPTDAEMAPRLKLTAVPYALSAGNLAKTNTTVRSTLTLQGGTVGDQIFQIDDQGAAGTYHLLAKNSGNIDYYIQNQGSGAQSANIFIQSGAAGTATAIFQGAASATAPSLVARAGASQTSNLFELQNSGGVALSNFDASGQLTLGRVTASGTTQAGSLKFADGTIDNFGATITTSTLTADRKFVLPDTTLATTASPATICVFNGSTSNCPAATGSTGYIWNSTTQQPSSNFNISDTGIAGVSILTPLINAPNGTTVLDVGATADTAALNLNRNVTLAGGKNFSFGAGAGNFDQSASTGTFATGSGAVSLNGATTIAANMGLTLANGTGTITQNYSNSVNNANAENKLVTNTSTAGAVAINALKIGLDGTNTTGSNTNTGINFGNVAAYTNNTFNGISFGSGYNNVLTVGGTSIISGTGILQSAGLSGSYSNALTFSNTANSYTGANISITATSGVAATIQGASAQHIADFKTSGGTTTTYLDQFGYLYAPGAVLSLTGAANNQTANQITVTNSNTANATVNSYGQTIGLAGAVNSNGLKNVNVGSFYATVTPTTGNYFAALGFGTGYDSLLLYNGTSLVSGTGLFQNAGFDSALNYSNLQKVTNLTATGNVDIQGTTKVALSATTGTALVCQNASGILASCTNGYATGTGAAFVQGGNSFAAAADLGTNDLNNLNFRTNNATRATIDTTGNLSFAQASTISTSAGNNNLTVQANGTGTLLLNTTGAGTVNIGTTNSTVVGVGNISASFTAESNATASLFNGNTAHTVQIATGAAGANSNAVTIGSTSAGSTTTVQGGTGASAVSIQAGSGGTIGVGTTANNVIAIGTANVAGTITVGGTGTTGILTFGQTSTANNTINIGAAVGNTFTQAINIGTSATAGSTTNVAIGSAISTSTTTIQSGTGGLTLQTQGTGVLGIGNNAVAQTITVGNTTGATALTLQAGTGGITVTGTATATTASYLCLGTGNKLSSCNTTGTGAAFVQGGNNFGATAVLGTLDANGLQIVTGSGGPNGRAFFDTSNNLYLGNAGSTGTAAAPSNFNIKGTSSSTVGTAGGNLSIAAGAGATTTTGSAGGNLTLTAGAAGGTGSVNGGNATLQAGNGSANSTTSNGGTLTLQGGNVTYNLGGNGGGVTLAGGDTSANSVGGNVTIRGGNSTATGLGGTGGNVTILAGTSNDVIGSVIINNTGADTIIGSTISASTVSISGGVNGTTPTVSLQAATSGYIAIGTTNANTVQIGAVGSTANSSTIHIADSSAGAQTVTIGSQNSTSTTTLQSGSGNIRLLTNGGASSTTGTVVQSATNNSTAAFQIQNASSVAILTVDTTNKKVLIGDATSSTLSINTTNALGALTVQDDAVNGRPNVVLRGSAGKTTDYLDIKDNANNVALQIASNGSALFKSIANSTTAFQVQDASGASMLQVDTTNKVIKTLGGVNAGCVTSGCASVVFDSAATSTQNVVDFNVAGTNRALVRADSLGNFALNATGGGTLYLNNDTGTGGVKVGSTTNSNNLTVFGNTIISPVTDSATALQIQSAAGNNVLTADTTADSANLIVNPGFESAGTATWAAKSGAAFSRSTAQHYSGQASMTVTTTAAANDGVKYPLVLSPNTFYNISFNAYGGSAFSTLAFGYAADGATEATYVTSGQSVANGSWKHYYMNFTTPATVNAGAYLFVKQTDAVSHTLYVDNVDVDAIQYGGLAYAGSYNDTRISLGGAGSSITNLGIGTATPHGAIEIDQKFGQTGLFLVGSGDSGLSAANLVQIANGDGSTAISYSEPIHRTIIQGGNTFFDTAALQVNTTATGATALRVSGAASQVADIFQVSTDTSSTNKVFSVGASGAVTIKTDSTTGLVLNNTLGQQIFGFDQTAKVFGIGSSLNATGSIRFYNSANSNYTALNATTPATGSFTISLPSVSANATICTTDAVCSLGSGGTNNYLTQVPTSNSANAAGANVISPTAASIIGLTVNATTGTAATAAVINQTQAAVGLQINNSSTSSSLAITTTGNPGAGSALILANNNSATPSGNLIDLQNKGTSKFSVDANGNVVVTNNISQTYSSGTTNTSAENKAVTNSSAAGSATVNGLSVALTGTNTTGANTNNAINLTTTNAATNNTYNALNFGTGFTNLLTSADATLAGTGALTLGATNHAANISISNNTATTSLNIATNTTPTTAAIVINDTSGVATDKLISLQASGTPKFTVDASGNTVNMGTLAIGTNAVSSGAVTTTLVGTSYIQTGSITAGWGGIGFSSTLNIANYALAGSSGGTIINAPAATGIFFALNGSVNIGQFDASGNFFVGPNTTTFEVTAGGAISTNTATTGSGLSITQSGNPTGNNALVFANNTNAAASGNLLNLQNNGTNKFTVDASGNVVEAGNLTVGGSTIQFLQGGNKTVNIAQSTGTTGYNLTVAGGQGAAGNNNGGGLILAGGAGTGTGVQGLVQLAPTAFNTSPTVTLAGTNDLNTITSPAKYVDLYSTIPVSASGTGYTLTVNAPTTATIGRILYLENVGTNDFTILLAGTSISIGLKANSTATLIWNGNGWTAAGASSSTDLQAAYANTLTSAGGAELFVSYSSNHDGLTIRDSLTNSVSANTTNGTLLEVQTNQAANLFSVNSKVTDYANNGGAESALGSEWAASGTASITRNTSATYNANGTGSVKVTTTGTAATGAKNVLNSTLTANLHYTVSFAAKLDSASSGSFTDIEVDYTKDGTATTACTNYSTQTIPRSTWVKVNCNFTAPASGITSANGILIRQTGAASRSWYVDNLSVTIAADLNYATDGGVDDNVNFATNWPALGTPTITRDTTTGNDTSDSAKIVTAASTNQGIKNVLGINPLPSTLYRISVYTKLNSGTFTDFTIAYAPDDGGVAGANTQQCTDYNTQTISTTAWTQVTCYVTASAAAVTAPRVYFYQPTGTARTFWVDTFSMTMSSNAVPNVQIGGGVNGGPTTLLTLDRAASAPIAANNDALLGSMYYDTTLGKLQCYESDGWGACGSSPDNIITISPEYTNAVMHGTGVGTMISDICSNTAVLSINTSICSSNETYNFYKWTSPQATTQTYSIYVTYQLPSTFKSFASGQTYVMGRTDNGASGGSATVQYSVYRNNATSGLTACGSAITVSTGTSSSWSTAAATGTADPSTCGFGPSDSILLKIDVIANKDASAYVGNLGFTFSNK